MGSAANRNPHLDLKAASQLFGQYKPLLLLCPIMKKPGFPGFRFLACERHRISFGRYCTWAIQQLDVGQWRVIADAKSTLQDA
jgi:hypothetical protein